MTRPEEDTLDAHRRHATRTKERDGTSGAGGNKKKKRRKKKPKMVRGESLHQQMTALLEILAAAKADDMDAIDEIKKRGILSKVGGGGDGPEGSSPGSKGGGSTSRTEDEEGSFTSSSSAGTEDEGDVKGNEAEMPLNESIGRIIGTLEECKADEPRTRKLEITENGEKKTIEVPLATRMRRLSSGNSTAFSAVKFDAKDGKKSDDAGGGSAAHRSRDRSARETEEKQRDRDRGAWGGEPTVPTKEEKAAAVAANAAAAEAAAEPQPSRLSAATKERGGAATGAEPYRAPDVPFMSQLHREMSARSYGNIGVPDDATAISDLTMPTVDTRHIPHRSEMYGGLTSRDPSFERANRQFGLLSALELERQTLSLEKEEKRAAEVKAAAKLKAAEEVAVADRATKEERDRTLGRVAAAKVETDASQRKQRRRGSHLTQDTEVDHTDALLGENRRSAMRKRNSVEVEGFGSTDSAKGGNDDDDDKIPHWGSSKERVEAIERQGSETTPRRSQDDMEIGRTRPTLSPAPPSQEDLKDGLGPLTPPKSKGRGAAAARRSNALTASAPPTISMAAAAAADGGKQSAGVAGAARGAPLAATTERDGAVTRPSAAGALAPPPAVKRPPSILRNGSGAAATAAPVDLGAAAASAHGTSGSPAVAYVTAPLPPLPIPMSPDKPGSPADESPTFFPTPADGDKSGDAAFNAMATGTSDKTSDRKKRKTPTLGLKGGITRRSLLRKGKYASANTSGNESNRGGGLSLETPGNDARNKRKMGLMGRSSVRRGAPLDDDNKSVTSRAGLLAHADTPSDASTVAGGGNKPIPDPSTDNAEKKGKDDDLEGVLSTMGKDIDFIFRELSALEDEEGMGVPSDDESIASHYTETTMGATAKIKYTLGSVASTLRGPKQQHDKTPRPSILKKPHAPRGFDMVQSEHGSEDNDKANRGVLRRQRKDQRPRPRMSNGSSQKNLLASQRHLAPRNSWGVLPDVNEHEEYVHPPVPDSAAPPAPSSAPASAPPPEDPLLIDEDGFIISSSTPVQTNTNDHEVVQNDGFTPFDAAAAATASWDHDGDKPPMGAASGKVAEEPISSRTKISIDSDGFIYTGAGENPTIEGNGHKSGSPKNAEGRMWFKAPEEQAGDKKDLEKSERRERKKSSSSKRRHKEKAAEKPEGGDEKDDSKSSSSTRERKKRESSKRREKRRERKEKHESDRHRRSSRHHRDAKKVSSSLTSKEEVEEIGIKNIPASSQVKKDSDEPVNPEDSHFSEAPKEKGEATTEDATDRDEKPVSNEESQKDSEKASPQTEGSSVLDMPEEAVLDAINTQSEKASSSEEVQKSSLGKAEELMSSIKKDHNRTSSSFSAVRAEAKALTKESRIDAVEAATKRRIEMLRKLVMERAMQENEELQKSEGKPDADKVLNMKLDFVEEETMKQISRLRDKLTSTQVQSRRTLLNNVGGAKR